jgi:hypothetical protein
MKILRNLITSIVLMLTASVMLNAQDITVIGLEGEVYVMHMDGNKKQYAQLVYGPMKNAEMIVLKAGSMIKLVNEKKEVCTINQPGDYSISNLEFEITKDQSTFGKFYDYFHSFFSSHESTESKKNYKNTVYAISRGSMVSPSLDFPIEGVVPYGRLLSLPFIWTHDCESCTYELQIYDYSTRKTVFSVKTLDQKFDLENSDKYLKSGNKYYWTVQIEGQEVDTEKVIFTMSKKADFETTISTLKNDFSLASEQISEIGKSIYILSNLEQSGLLNYSILYGFHLKEKYPNNEGINNICDRQWYDYLLNK